MKISVERVTKVTFKFQNNICIKQPGNKCWEMWKMQPPEQKHSLKCNWRQERPPAGKLWSALTDQVVDFFFFRLYEKLWEDLIITQVHWRQEVTCIPPLLDKSQKD